MAVIFSGVDSLNKKLSATIQETVKQVSDQVYQTVTNKRGLITPVKTGYTRDKWQKKTTDKNFEVSNRVPWIEKLEAGASRQAPRGIIGPTLTAIKGK